MNFEDMISNALKEGKSITEVAKEFTASMNKVASKQNDFEKEIEKLEKSDRLADKVVAVTYKAAKKKPDWDLEELKKYNKYVSEVINGLLDTYENYKDISDVMTFFDSFLNRLAED